MVTHLDLLRAVTEEGTLTFISTGMSTYDEIDVAVKLSEGTTAPDANVYCA